MNFNQITPHVITTAPKTINELTGTDPSETVALTCINLPEALIIVDCGADTEKAKKFRYIMEEHFNKEISHLLLTHAHWDHSDALNVFQDVSVVISKKGATKIKADIKVAESFTIGSKRNEVFFQVSEGHSPDSAFVLYPSDKVLITGDNLLSCYAQVFSNGKIVLDLYRHWESLDVKHIIPGHGFVVDKDYLMNVRAYFEDLISVLKKLESLGLTINQVLKHPDLPEYCYKDHALWEEGGRRHTGWVNSGIKYWYRHV
ncbi:MAG: MBL fold metallo-hydrolase [Candidatus Heimdallarchaeota archaeon]|nr:MAG: MBL fold metallo-hydrolase [Candidatus Heimdallarchaeota archaeon]